MLRDPVSLRNRIVPERRVIHLFASALCALGLLSGCTTSVKVPTAIYRPARPSMTDGLTPANGRSVEETTVRSQDSELPSPWTTPTVHASSVPGNTAHVGHSVLKAVSQQDLQNATPGHTFVKPRAKLGRPILNTQFAPSQTVDGDVGDGANREPVPLGPQGQRVASQRPASPGSLEPGQIPTETNAASPWLLPKNSGWQSAAPSTAAGAGLRSGVTNGGNSDGFRPPQTSGQPALSNDPEIAEPLIQRETPGTIPESLTHDSSGREKAAEDVAAAVPEEPTMLDRLRGLYTPRIDENTDKIRKQIRRWPDPFGLLKDRVDVPPVPAVPEVAPSGSEQITAETPDVTSGVSSQLEDPSHAIQAVIAEVEKELADWPRTPAGRPENPERWRQRQTDLRLLYLISGRSAEAMRVIEALPEAEQEFWQSLMLSMNRYREPADSLSRSERLTESLDHLRTAAKKLQPLSKLAIRRLMLCSRIDGFGNVAEFPTANFEPGQRILVYAELQNFQSELTDEGRYRSEFAAVLDFMREGDDEVLVTQRIPRMEDVCDVERTDYFQSYELTLPALEGRYRMRIRLRDQLSLQTAESQLEFTVRSRGAGL